MPPVVAEKKCSGHAATSIGLLTYLLLELFVCHPDLLCGQRRTGGGTAAYSFEWGYGWHAPRSTSGGGGGGDDDDADRAAANAGGACAPPPDSLAVRIFDDDDDDDDDGRTSGGDGDGAVDNATTRRPPFGGGRWEHHRYALLYALLFLPVPFSRVYLHDHTREQVLAGSAAGAAISAIWYFCVIRACDGTRLLKRWGRSGCGRWWGLRFGAEAAESAAGA
jgi:hypothetical protein